MDHAIKVIDNIICRSLDYLVFLPLSRYREIGLLVEIAIFPTPRIELALLHMCWGLRWNFMKLFVTNTTHLYTILPFNVDFQMFKTSGPQTEDACLPNCRFLSDRQRRIWLLMTVQLMSLMRFVEHGLYILIQHCLQVDLSFNLRRTIE